MQFSEILAALGPENIVPERLMNDLLAIQTPNELEDALALLLAEIISPASQNLTGVSGQITALTPSSIPEASARGSQFGSIIRNLPQQLTWSNIFQRVANRLPSPAFTEASLSAILSALDDQTIDSFLEFNWNLNFKVNLFVNLRKLNPSHGAFDLLRTNYLRPIVNDPSFPNLKSSVLFFANVTRLELDCISMSSAITSMEFKKFLHTIFEEDIRSVPELIALGCVHFNPQSATIDDLFENLMVHLLDDSSSYYSLILKDLDRKDLIIQVCSKMYKNSLDLNPQMLSLLVSKGYFQEFLSSLSFERALTISSKAAKVSWGGFEEFLNRNCTSPDAVDSILKYLENVSDNEQRERHTRVVSLRTLHSLLKFVQQMELSPVQLGTLPEIQIRLYQSFPRLINFGYGHDEAILSNGDNAPFQADVEEQMKLCYQRMYSEQVDIKNLVEMLSRLRESNIPREQELYACMIHSLLDEYRFFQEYPLSALAKTSVLFGSMILYDLMRGPALSIGLKYISDSCSQPPDSNMFKFAVQALFAFKSRLAEFPNYCMLLSKIEALKAQPQVYQMIDDVTNNRVEHQIQEDSPATPKTQVFKSINPSCSVFNDVPQQKPDGDSNILFIINSLADDNVHIKAKNLKDDLKPSLYHWFAEYLVGKRAKAESNNQHLYAEIVELFDDSKLTEHLINVTVNQVNDLLNDHDETPAVRSHLKNLGSWLGRITLAKNRPLKFSSIAVKQLLVEASDLSKLALIIPFVCKILDQTNGSSVFKLPNPWTLGIVKVLSELYQFANLKLNLRFEIEVLCNNMKIKIDDIEPSTYLRSHRPADIQSNVILDTGISDLKIEIANDPLLHQSITGIPDNMNPRIIQQMLQQRPGVTSTPSASMVANGPLSAGGPGLLQHSVPQAPQLGVAPVLNEAQLQNILGNTSFATNESLKYMFSLAIAKSVRDILPPAVERSVNIAVTTARSLVLKDFATEPDDVKLRNSAITLVCHLAQGLALATCRDPLKESIQNAVQVQLVNADNSLFEELPQAINDNIDLACSLIESAAMDKAKQEIEEVLVQSIAARRAHKERRTDQPFFTQHLSRYSVSLPEPLGLRQNGVTPQQLQVYASFGNKALSSSPAQLLSQIQPQQQPELPMTPNPSSTGLSAQAAAQGPPQLVAVEQTLAYVQALIDNLVRAVGDSSAKTLGELSTDNSINMLLGQVLSLTSKCLSKDTLILNITQIIINALLTSTTVGFAAEIFVLLLKKICSISATAKRDVSGWFIHFSDDRKFNQRVLMALFEAELVSVSDFDPALASYIDEERPETYLFAMSLIKECFVSRDDVTFVSNFATTIQRLSVIDNVESIRTFMISLREVPMGMFGEDAIPESNRMEYVFMEWTHLINQQPSNDALHVAFVNQLVQSGTVSTNAKLFFKSAVELSMTFFRHSDSVNDGFFLADSFSKLLIKMLVAGEDLESQATLFKVALGALLEVFTSDHGESRENFNERPYFRIFSTLLSEFTSVDLSTTPEEAALKQMFYLTIADCLNVYQPLAFPGFAFAWITLISHRLFLPNIIELKHPKAHTKFVVLMLDLLAFQAKHVKEKQISEVFTVVYKGTLRIFLLLFHDYPEILVQNHYQLCCEIPSSFTQLRNVVLSACPESMVTPYPFTQGLKVDRIPEISEQPVVSCNAGHDLKGLKKAVDSFLRIPSNQLVKTILNGLKQNAVDDCGIGYAKTSFNVKLINALVLYIGVQAVSEKASNSPVVDQKSPHFILLSNLIQEGPVELQYQIVQAMCNQLRYPNSHTHWFIYTILHFFGAQNLWGNKKLQVQQILTRVILERLLCNRPHPWGLLITFTELLKNPELAFFDLSFIKSAPEVEALFQTLMKHMGARPNVQNDTDATPLHAAV